MNRKKLLEAYQFGFMLLTHYNQVRSWQDAAEARIARMRAEETAQAQLRAMLDANPSGQLGNARLDDETVLRESGLL
jgi:hypothetical protein